MIKVRISLLIILILLFLNFGYLYCWQIMPNHHGGLAKNTLACRSLPKPANICKDPVGKILLSLALQLGAAEPDLRDGPHKWFGLVSLSPKHAYNVDYEGNKNLWDPAIKQVISGNEINAGLGLLAIDEVINKKDEGLYYLLSNLKCDSTIFDYMKIWRKFGNLSHYAADLAVPWHAYSINVDGVYHEGDYIDGEGKWEKGLFEYATGIFVHGRADLALGYGANIGSLGCSLIPPEKVAYRARGKMINYHSLWFDNLRGYHGLMSDFLFAGYNGVDYSFFREIGPYQGRDAIGSIYYAWKEALANVELPENCPPDPYTCECNERACPPSDSPDDNVSPGLFDSFSFYDERIMEVWDEIATKKDKESLIYYWIQPYLYEEAMMGEIDAEAYDEISESYDLTAELAEERYYDDYVTTPDIAILSKGMGLSLSDLLENMLNEPTRRFK